MLQHFPEGFNATQAKEFRDLTRNPAPGFTSAEQVQRPDKLIRTNFEAYCHWYKEVNDQPAPAGKRGKALELSVYDALVTYGVPAESIRCDVLLGGHRARADFLVQGAERTIGIFVAVSLRERWMMMDRNAHVLMTCQDENIVPRRANAEKVPPRAFGIFLTERQGDSPERCLTLATEVTKELIADNTRIISLWDEHGICSMFEACGATIPR